jgi:hypothetical protein
MAQRNKIEFRAVKVRGVCFSLSARFHRRFFILILLLLLLFLYLIVILMFINFICSFRPPYVSSFFLNFISLSHVVLLDTENNIIYHSFIIFLFFFFFIIMICFVFLITRNEIKNLPDLLFKKKK